MKHKLRLLAYSFASALILFFSSCEREDSIKPAPNSKKLKTTSSSYSTDSKLEQKLQNTVVIGLLDLSENQYFRETLHELVADTFDGDYNTLVKTIETAWNAKGQNFLTAFNASLTAHKAKFPDYPVFTITDSITMAVRGLVFESKDTAFTQIYIPNFENWSNSPSKPSIAPGTFLVNTEKVPVLELDPNNGNGLIRPLEEAQANNEITWISTINESSGFYFDENDNPAYTPPIPPLGINSIKREVRVVASRLNHLNESWINGRAEIQIYMKQIKTVNSLYVDGQGYVPTNQWPFSDRGLTDLRGDHFRSLHRREEGEEWNYPNDEISPWLAANTSNYPIGPVPFSQGNVLYFVLFERDVSQFAPMKYATSDVTGVSIGYKSWDTHFLKYDFVFNSHGDSYDWQVIEIPVDGAYLAIKYRNF